MVVPHSHCTATCLCCRVSTVECRRVRVEFFSLVLSLILPLSEVSPFLAFTNKMRDGSHAKPVDIETNFTAGSRTRVRHSLS
jgi:hypothetical protein